MVAGTDLPSVIRWDAIAPLLLSAAAIMGSPGPATVSLVVSGATYGTRRSISYLLGIIVGTTLVLLGVALGITALLLTVPALQFVLVLVAAAYILWLAYHIATAPPLNTTTAAVAAPSAMGGLTLGLTNPKAWIAIAAVFGSGHVARSPTTDAILKVALLTGMIILINSVWLSAGSTLAPLLRQPRVARRVNIALAAVLVAATVLSIVH